MCILDRQITAEKAWETPFHLKSRLGFFDFPSLSPLKQSQFTNVMTKPTPLHRFPNEMSRNLYAAKEKIRTEYKGRANEIWNDHPSSAQVVRRFLEFDGVGQKIATMAANILARKFQIPMSDYYSIDISVDVQVRRVFWRLGFVPKDASSEYIIYRARELYPAYPGIIDYELWDLGRTVCLSQPLCDECKYSTWCKYAKQK